ncbi:MAG: hypothetical protein LBI13_07480 [Streptococcaceae bacterium]|jgi:hypothetical protein|nr:hypothetical protein [Streptococcaceae bacterium]
MSLAPLAQLAKDNLAKYSVYYAGNLPHKKGTDPELVAIIDNLDKIYIPNLDENSRVDDELDAKNYIYSVNKKYQYDFIFPEIKYKDSVVEWDFDKYEDPGNRKIFCIVIYPLSNSKREYFDSKGTPTYVLERDGSKHSPIQSDLKDIKEKREILIGNIIKTKQKPPINLQFIYNYLNKSKFN